MCSPGRLGNCGTGFWRLPMGRRPLGFAVFGAGFAVFGLAFLVAYFEFLPVTFCIPVAVAGWLICSTGFAIHISGLFQR
nr:putative integron gene cassette protein [uncultured bacterium]